MDTSGTRMRHEGTQFPPTPPPSSPKYPWLPKVRSPRLHFFTLFQTHNVCSCTCRHVSNGEKLTLRVMVSKTAEENIKLMRQLLRLENGDTMTFETENGVPVIPDYFGLKSRTDSTVKVMVFIKRKDGEVIQPLKKENARRGFEIYEEKPPKGWVVGMEDWYEKERCRCDSCMVLKEQEAYLEHLQQMVEEYRSEVSSNTRPEGELAHEDEVTLDRNTGSPASNPEGQGDVQDLEVSTRMGASYGRRSTSRPRAVDRDDMTYSTEGAYHYGRIIPRPSLYSNAIPRSVSRASSETTRQNAMPTDEEYGYAAAILRRMR